MVSHRVLRSSNHQSDILHDNSAGMLSDMPTFYLLLESFYSRDMWRSEDLISVYWSLQLIAGCRYRSFTIARSVGTSDGDGKEGRFKRPVLYGYSVRVVFHSQLFSAQSAT